MIVFKNKNNPKDVIWFEDINETPSVYKEIYDQSELNKELKPEEVIYIVGTEADIPKRPKIDEKQLKIDELKANLAATDYQAIKYAEGRMTDEEYAPIGEQRQTWRDEINQLQQ